MFLEIEVPLFGKSRPNARKDVSMAGCRRASERTYQANGSNAKPMAPMCAESSEERDQTRPGRTRQGVLLHMLYCNTRSTSP